MTVSIEAEIGIRRLHALCADAVWRKDGAGFADCFVEDGVWKVAGLELRGRETIARALGELGTANERILMIFGSPILSASDGCISGRTYTVENVKRYDGSAATTIGIYYEHFVERDGRWLFQRRHFDFSYFGPPDLSAPFYDFQDYGPPPAMPDFNQSTAGLQVND